MSDLLDRPIRQTWRVWAALAIPASMWGGRLLATWTVAEFACAHGWAGTAGYYLLQTSITVGALGLTAASGWVAWSVYRSEAAETVDSFDPATTMPFLALTGMVSALIFSLLIVAEGSSVYLVTCG